MGNTPSNKTEWTIGNTKFVCKDANKNKTVMHGSQVLVKMKLHIVSEMKNPMFFKDLAVDLQNHLTSYFKSHRFIKDLNSTILFRYKSLNDEYDTNIPEMTLEDLGWIAKEHAVMSKNKDFVVVTFPIMFLSNVLHKYYDACRYLSAAIAWHVKSGTIPINDSELYADNIYLDVRLVKIYPIEIT